MIYCSMYFVGVGNKFYSVFGGFYKYFIFYVSFNTVIYCISCVVYYRVIFYFP